MKTVRRVAIVALMGSIAAVAGDGPGVDVRRYGALGDGQTNDTAAIQRAIDACAGSGGGTVYLPPGTYISGSLHLRSPVTVRLDAGSTGLRPGRGTRV